MKAKKYNRLFILKITFNTFSIILLSVLLYLLVEISDDFFADNTVKQGIIITSLLLATFLILSFIEVLSVKEYKGHFIRRNFIKRGRSYLTLQDIFENENRVNILTQILKNPGIHQNELLRSCDLKKGQLQWHLDVLLKHNIIKKEHSGQYVTYFPITASFEADDNLKILLSKSRKGRNIELYPK
jgi:predicted transcriptional regulator